MLELQKMTPRELQEDSIQRMDYDNDGGILSPTTSGSSRTKLIDMASEVKAALPLFTRIEV